MGLPKQIVEKKFNSYAINDVIRRIDGIRNWILKINLKKYFVIFLFCLYPEFCTLLQNDPVAQSPKPAVTLFS